MMLSQNYMETNLENHPDSYRYERKFFIESEPVERVERQLLTHPAMFNEIYHQRYVNSVYFDTVAFKCLHDNIEGQTHRDKVRVRWYGALKQTVVDARLEVKRKRGMLGQKDIAPIAPFTSPDHVADLAKWLPERWRTLVPVVLVRYIRRYYRSACHRFRVTVDTDIVSGVPLGDIPLVRHTHIVLEVKYDQADDAAADLVTANFSFRPTRSSKFVTAMHTLY